MATRCPFCASEDTIAVTDRLRFGRSARVVRCGTCSLVFLDQESFRYPPDFYEREYHQTYLTHVEPAALDPAAYFSRMTVASKLWVDRIRALLRGGETVLDVGCSTGHVMVGIRDRAKAVYGHELNPREIAYCRDELGLDVDSSPLRSRFAPGSFDYIVLIFVLEHIGEPVAFLRELRPLLKPEGRLIVVVPNVEDPLLELYDIAPFREFYYCIEHLYYFSPATLERCLDLAGFDASIERVQEYPLANHLNWALRQQPSDTLASRSVTLPAPLREGATSRWNELWQGLDAQYRGFLERSGLSDRLWAIASPRT